MESIGSITLSAGSKSVTVSPKDLEDAAKYGIEDAVKLSDLRRQLEDVARHRRNVNDEKKETMKGFKEELDGIDETETRLLNQIDAITGQKPLPLFDEKKEEM